MSVGPTSQDIIWLITVIERAERDVAFASTVVMEPEQIEGTRYQYILTDNT